MSDRSAGRRFRVSFGVSSLLHLVLCIVFVPVAVNGTIDLGRAGGEPKLADALRIETITVTHQRVPNLHHAQHAAPRRVAVVTPAPRSPLTHAAPAVRQRASNTGISHRLVARLSRLRIPVPVLMATAAPEERAPIAAPSVERSSAPVASSASGPPATAAPTASASPSPVPDDRAVAESGIDVPAGGWGQNFAEPIVADDNALDALRVRYHGATIVVDVDRSGRATSVSLLGGLSDDVRAALQRRLLEMRYVPAECNGLRCDGTLQITL